MYTKPNQILLPLSLLKDYIQMHQEQGEALDWIKILDLGERPPVSLIQVSANENKANVLAFVEWGWKEKVIKIGKIKVVEALRNQGIGNIMMKMIFAIANYYGASKIVGVIDGEPFLWDWYSKLGFMIYDGNKLLMNLEDSQ